MFMGLSISRFSQRSDHQTSLNEIAVVSIMHSNNETGVIQPIQEVVAMAGDIPVHTDAVQSFARRFHCLIKILVYNSA